MKMMLSHSRPTLLGKLRDQRLRHLRRRSGLLAIGLAAAFAAHAQGNGQWTCLVGPPGPFQARPADSGSTWADMMAVTLGAPDGSTHGKVVQWRQTAPGVFAPYEPAVEGAPPDWDPFEFEIGDVNGDGWDDIGVSDWKQGDEAIRIFISTAVDPRAPRSLALTISTSPEVTFALMFADLNRDGLPDILHLLGPNVLVYRNLGVSGANWRQFEEPRAYDAGVGEPPDNFAWPGSLAVGDVNGDGWPDIWADGLLLTNNGAGLFLPAPRHDDPKGWASSIQDVDGDGKNELVVIDPTGTARVYQWQEGQLIQLTSFPVPPGVEMNGFGFVRPGVGTGPRGRGLAAAGGPALPGLALNNGEGIYRMDQTAPLEFGPPVLLKEGAFGSLTIADVFPESPGDEIIAPELGSPEKPGNQVCIFFLPPAPSGIAGTKFRDDNGNQKRDPGEPGILGVTITLDTGAKAVTDADGHYEFGDLDPGKYTVTETVPAGSIATTDTSQDVTVTAGKVTQPVDFGNVPTPAPIPDPNPAGLGAIIGWKFLDLNADGAWGWGEPGLGGVKINLDGGPPGGAQAVTAANGSYGFLAAPGPHNLSELVPNDWTPTTPTTQALMVVANQTTRADPFGNIPLADFGDARQEHDPFLPWMDRWPAGYPVTLNRGGAWHVVDESIRLGPEIDGEMDGAPSFYALGDDTRQQADEDGIMFFNGPPPNGAPDTPFVFDPLHIPVLHYGPNWIRALNTVSGNLRAWVDFNQDGQWDDNAEDILRDEPLTQGLPTGPNRPNLRFTVPLDAQTGFTYARFRFSRQAIAGPMNGAPDGEVEDYLIVVGDEFDFGDAPKPYPTLEADDGARHSGALLRLGNELDFEPDGQPSPEANGDDAYVQGFGADDEDGVFFMSKVATGGTAKLLVMAGLYGHGVLDKAVLDGWMDFNSDGDWDDPNEKIVDGATVWDGSNNLEFSVPTDAVVTNRAYARFRLSPQGVTRPTGYGGPGEVEDYVWPIVAGPPTLSWTPAAGGALELSWPTGTTGYRLEKTSRVEGPWLDANLPVTMVGNTAHVTVPFSGQQEFFRLHQIP